MEPATPHGKKKNKKTRAFKERQVTCNLNAEETRLCQGVCRSMQMRCKWPRVSPGLPMSSAKQPASSEVQPGRVCARSSHLGPRDGG